jgi:lysophospholipase L1-like esterase
MVLLAAAISAALLACAALMAVWTADYVGALGTPRLVVPDVQLRPAPVGGHPSGSEPWFLVVGDSISAGITPGTLGDGPNPSWVADLAQRLAATRHAWKPDDLACPTESTATYFSGCLLAFSNPLLGGRAQRQVALADVAAHRSTLRLMVVELGANDLLGMSREGFGRESAAVLSRLGRIAGELQAAAPGVPLFLANVYDPYSGGPDSFSAQIRAFDDGVAALAADRGATLVDFASAMVPGRTTSRARICRLVECQGDGEHPTRRGERALAGAAFQAIDGSGLLGPSL